MFKAFAAVAVLFTSVSAVAQPASPAVDWKDWKPMLGEWDADATGPTGGYSLATACKAASWCARITRSIRRRSTVRRMHMT